MTDDDDEIWKDRILNRFDFIFEHGPPGLTYGTSSTRLGRPKSADWHQLAISYVARREAEGASRNEACREFQKKLAEASNLNVSDETVMDVVRSHYGRHLQHEAEQAFCNAVLDNDIDDAVKWLKVLSSKRRAKWDLG